MDMADWELLTKQLEDTVALSTLLQINIPASEKGPTEPEATKEPIRVSVAKLLEGGKGMFIFMFISSSGFKYLHVTSLFLLYLDILTSQFVVCILDTRGVVCEKVPNGWYPSAGLKC